MELTEILDDHIIQIGMDAQSKDDALHQLSELLYRNGYINDIDVFVKDIYEREAVGMTGIGNGVAIPHGKSDCVKRLGIAIATLKKEIAWETLDGKKVNTIFLFCVNNDENFAKNHLRLLSKIAAKLADDELLSKLKMSKTAKTFITVLSKQGTIHA